ncbi:MAG: hypothetical protein KJT03_20575 [Verrucomicrobiae bacterium]|nr:hypothetical protein [Verrucomicrobiae bacterium]
MKFPLPLLLTTLIILTGCANQPLSLDQDGPQLAPTLGTEAADIRFINHCIFTTVDESVSKASLEKKGIIALTDTDLFLVKGNLSSAGPDDVQQIPITSIDGIASLLSHLQIKYQDQILIVRPYKWYGDTVDWNQSWNLFKALTAENVPVFDPSTTYGLNHVVDSRNPGVNRSAYREDFPDNQRDSIYATRQEPYTSQDGSVYNTGASTRSVPR